MMKKMKREREKIFVSVGCQKGIFFLCTKNASLIKMNE